MGALALTAKAAEEYKDDSGSDSATSVWAGAGVGSGAASSDETVDTEVENVETNYPQLFDVYICKDYSSKVISYLTASDTSKLSMVNTVTHGVLKGKLQVLQFFSVAHLPDVTLFGELRRACLFGMDVSLEIPSGTYNAGNIDQLKRDLIHCDAVTSLDLSRNFIDVLGVEAILNAKSLKKLSKLYLTGSIRGQFNIGIFETSLNFHHLQLLALDDCNINENGARAIATSKAFINITGLYLSSNNIGDVGVSALAASTTLRRLKSLYLGSNGIGPVGAEAIATSPAFGDLDALDLSNNPIRTSGVKKFVGSTILTRLSLLDLTGARIGSLGASKFIKAKNFPNLKRCSLMSNGIDEDGGIEILEEFAIHDYAPKLADFYLGANPLISTETRRLIMEKFPFVKF